MRLGVPTHYRPDPERNTTACGFPHVSFSTLNVEKVDCLNCRHSLVFRKHLAEHKAQNEGKSI